MGRKKKDVDSVNEELDEISEESDEGYYNATAYLPVYNIERKSFDMFLIRVDTINKKAFVEIEKVRYDTDARALHDLIARVTNDFVKTPTKRK